MAKTEQPQPGSTQRLKALPGRNSAMFKFTKAALVNQISRRWRARPHGRSRKVVEQAPSRHRRHANPVSVRRSGPACRSYDFAGGEHAQAAGEEQINAFEGDERHKEIGWRLVLQKERPGGAGIGWIDQVPVISEAGRRMSATDGVASGPLPRLASEFKSPHSSTGALRWRTEANNSPA
jgi:hypothetical protein